MLRDLRQLVSTFSPADRSKLLLVTVAQFAVALMDLVGLAAVLPVMQVMTGASLEHGYLGWLYSHLPWVNSRSSFVLVMVIEMVLAFCGKAIAGLAVNWWSTGLVLRLQITTSVRLLRSYMSESYLRFKQRDVSEGIRTVDTAAADAHYKVLGGVMALFGAALNAVVILGLMLVVTPWVTLAALAYFGIAVYGLQKLLSDRNTRSGEVAVHAAWKRSLALYNALHGFREIRMHDAEEEFVERFSQESAVFSGASRRANFYALVPKYVLELISITGIALILALVMLLSDHPAAMMPQLSVFVAATVKLLPIMNSFTANLGTMRSGSAGLSLTVEALARLQEAAPAPEVSAGEVGVAQAPRADLLVEGVTFRYPGGMRDVLSEVSIRVPAGGSLALCGPSGSGKTTLVDIMLGLIESDKGTVTYGGVPLTELGRRWHDLVAYVPQDVFLLNDTLAANVAFGVPEGERDDARVRACLDQAQLSEVVDALDGGIHAEIGERGSRLSGGQRQRIGIARALYRDPQVIVFDEATSALDNETEDQITRAIQALNGRITTIIVAHRLSTVRHVDQLLFLEDGRIAGLGSFAEVRRQSAHFERMVSLGRLDEEPDPALVEAQ